MLNFSSLNQFKKNHAFTLIEVLVVVLLVSIIVSFVTISYRGGNQERELEEFAKQIKALCLYARDQAIFNSEELGLIINNQDRKIQFVWLDEEQKWQSFKNDKVYRDRDIPVFIDIDVTLEGERVVLTNPDDEQSTELPPQILFLSSGEFIPFELQMSAKGIDNTFRIKGKFTGELELYKNDDKM